ncbi:MAG: hypothetical protein HOI66_14735 [Verrucomicrobia bacterium]|nr:hypothetical protein [Verrucomicrobiota bacterium]
MKQVIEAPSSSHSLEHSMIDENTRQGWAYYADHTDRQSQLARAASEAKAKASRVSKRPSPPRSR